MTGPRFVLAIVAAYGCGDPPARVALVPISVGDSACGRPKGANQLSITAFATSGQVTRAVGLGAPIEIADFPADTVQLGVEVLVGGGDTGAAGKTLPLDFGALDDGAAIPVMMAPPGGFCPVGALVEPRRGPLVARAGEGVLVVGGVGPAGPLSTAERYDPRTATFAPVDVPDALQDPVNGLAGAVLATLPDGRVVLTGGSRGLMAIYDPDSGQFGAAFAFAPPRAFHGAIATDGGLLVAGGCNGVAGQTCDALPLRSSFVYDLEGNTLATGPNLAPTAISEGAQLIDSGTDFILTGGFGNPGEASRFTLDDREAELVTGLGAQATLLDGGALFTAFAPDAAAKSGLVRVVAPGGGVAALGNGPALVGARLVTLEDGRVLAVGGDPDRIEQDGAARVALYDPTRDSWAFEFPAFTPADAPRAGDQPATLVAPAAIRLGDGSVLVLGGDAAPSQSAWIYRPSLVGPAAGSVTAVPASATSPAVLTASDPATLTRTPEWVLTAPDDALTARALVGGPRMQRGSVRAIVNVQAGGLALIAQQVTPGRALVAHLVPGEQARVEQLASGTVCTGDPVELPANPVTATLEVGDGITVRLGDTVVLACNERATDVGAWGVAADGAGSRIAVATVTVAR
ncbi:MAG TPA: hypothetical protein VFQ53_37320 [Kofleriaceae bacterium]|nr:hypothetical protein [Kofleriaceae bacterium]